MKTECKSNATKGVAGEQLEFNFGRTDGEIGATRRYSVVITDMFHYDDSGDEFPVETFETFAQAKEYARDFVRDQVVEAIETCGYDREALKLAVVRWGEDASVRGGRTGESHSGTNDLDYFIDQILRQAGAPL